MTENGTGWGVTLDGKLLMTPAGHRLVLPGRALAAAIAAEWDAQAEFVRPRTMPMMQFAATGIDRVGSGRVRVVAELAGYGATDLVCYRATEPPVLVARERQCWDPLIDWMHRRYEVALAVTTGVMALPQPPAALETLSRVIDGHDDLTLAALATLVCASGSLVIGLAALERELTPEQAAHAAQLDELFQAERWGEDPESIARRVTQLQELVSARHFLDLLARG